MAAYLLIRIACDQPDLLQDYQSVTPAIVKKYQGRFLARGGKTVTLEGPLESRRLVIIEFPDMDAAKAFYHSPEYSDARLLREGVAKAEFVALQGL